MEPRLYLHIYLDKEKAVRRFAKWQLISRLLVVQLFVALTGSAYADCVSLVKGPIIFDIDSCQTVDVSRDLALQDEAYKSVGGLDPQMKGKLFNSYRGTLLKG